MPQSPRVNPGPRPEPGGKSGNSGNSLEYPQIRENPQGAKSYWSARNGNPGNVNGLFPELPFEGGRWGKALRVPGLSQDLEAPPGPAVPALLRSCRTPGAGAAVPGGPGGPSHHSGGPGAPLRSWRWGSPGDRRVGIDLAEEEELGAGGEAQAALGGWKARIN